MQKVHLIQHQSHRVLFLCKSTQLRVYIRYKITLFIVWQQFCSHHFCVVAEVLGFVSFCFFLLRKTLWPFFWGGTVVGTESKKKFKRQPDELTVRKTNKWDYVWKCGIFHSIIYNLNQSGADLEIFYNTLRFICLNFFLRICFVLSF